MTDATAGGEEPETLEESGTEGAVPETGVDVEAADEAGAEMEREAPRQAPAGHRVLRPSVLGASQVDRLFGRSGTLARTLWPTDRFRLSHQSPGQDMARRFTTGWSQRFMAASGITGWSERFMAASGATERHRRLFAQLTEGVALPEAWKSLVPRPSIFDI